MSSDLIIPRGIGMTEREKIVHLFQCMTVFFSAAASCPSSHPFAFDDGQSCCWSYNKIDDPGNPALDGSPLEYTDPQNYCENYISPHVAVVGQKLKTDLKNLGNTEKKCWQTKQRNDKFT